MTDQIKPRYRLGTQNMLDLAKDDATKIPERTLFRLKQYGGSKRLPLGAIVVREKFAKFDADDWSSVRFLALENGKTGYVFVRELQSLI